MGKPQFTYLRIRNQLYNDILEGRFRQGERLPSERQLCEEYSVSRSTVRQAISALEQDGYVKSKHGSGTYVCAPSEPSENVKPARSVAVMVPELKTALFRELVHTISCEAAENNIPLLLTSHQDSIEIFERSLRQMKSQGVGVALIVLPRDLDKVDPRSFVRTGVNSILLVRDHPEVVCDKLLIDNVAVGGQCTQLLLGQGCRAPLFIGPLDYLTAWDRLRGYRQALVGAGLEYQPDLVLDISAKPEEMLEAAQGAVRRLLQKGVAFDGVFAFNDLIARAVVQFLNHQHIRVPDQVAVVGVDNHEASVRCDIPLTTIDFDGAGAGRKIFDLVLQRLKQREVNQSVAFIPMKVIARKSCPVLAGTVTKAGREAVELTDEAENVKEGIS